MFIAAQEGQDEALSVLIGAGANANTATNVSYSNILPITVYMYYNMSELFNIHVTQCT